MELTKVAREGGPVSRKICDSARPTIKNHHRRHEAVNEDAQATERRQPV